MFYHEKQNSHSKFGPFWYTERCTFVGGLVTSGSHMFSEIISHFYPRLKIHFLSKNLIHRSLESKVIHVCSFQSTVKNTVFVSPRPFFDTSQTIYLSTHLVNFSFRAAIFFFVKSSSFPTQCQSFMPYIEKNGQGQELSVFQRFLRYETRTVGSLAVFWQFSRYGTAIEGYGTDTEPLNLKIIDTEPPFGGFFRTLISTVQFVVFLIKCAKKHVLKSSLNICSI